MMPVCGHGLGIQPCGQQGTSVPAPSKPGAGGKGPPLTGALQHLLKIEWITFDDGLMGELFHPPVLAALLPNSSHQLQQLVGIWSITLRPSAYRRIRILIVRTSASLYLPAFSGCQAGGYRPTRP